MGTGAALHRPSRPGSWLPPCGRATGVRRAAMGGLTVAAFDIRPLHATATTAALELAAMLLDLEPGDTVIVPSFTFVTTALAFAREGAQLLFADIEPDTFGIDPASVADLMDDSVRAVIP